MKLNSSQWHMVSSSDSVILFDGNIIGVIFDNFVTLFNGETEWYEQAHLMNLGRITILTKH
jgi:hypothetical protein